MTDLCKTCGAPVAEHGAMMTCPPPETLPKSVDDAVAFFTFDSWTPPLDGSYTQGARLARAVVHLRAERDELLAAINGHTGGPDGCFATIRELRAEVAKLREALREIRDDVLNCCGPLSDNGMTSDQFNDVLGVIDDHTPLEVSRSCGLPAENAGHTVAATEPATTKPTDTPPETGPTNRAPQPVSKPEAKPLAATTKDEVLRG